jgi:hypothetical protein
LRKISQAIGFASEIQQLRELQIPRSARNDKYVGQWFDRKLGTSWLAIVGAFTGAALGFFNMYRKLMAAQAADEAERKAKREQGK